MNEEPLELVKLSVARQAIIEAKTIHEIKAIRDQAEACRQWARKRERSIEIQNDLAEIVIEAEAKAGEILKAMAADGDRVGRHDGRRKSNDTMSLEKLGVSGKQSERWQLTASVDPAEREHYFAEQREKGEAITSGGVQRLARQERARERLDGIRSGKVVAPEGLYDVIVIDPPWPMERIEREVRPNQTDELEYPTMTTTELELLEIPCAAFCHAWLWTTHRFLPMALRLLDAWHLKYVCTFVWHKPGGYQPVGLPQYNCEFALYARRGSPVFLETKALPTCFTAPRGKHSEKPEAFYDTVRRVTGGRRLDMFARREIDGFDRWGLEADGR